MTAEIAALAQQIGPYLAPALPYLIKGAITTGEEAAKALGKKLGEGDWLKSVKLWEKLKAQVEKQPEVAKKLDEVAAKADDPRAEVLLSWELEKVLAALSPDELQGLRTVLSEGGSSSITITISQGKRSVAISGGAQGATIITGDQPALQTKKKH